MVRLLLAFYPKILGGGGHQQMVLFYECRWGCHETVRILEPYLMQKNLFELFALTGSSDVNILGTCTCNQVRAPNEPLGSFSTTYYFTAQIS